jgi:hypothetical protein
MENYRTVRNFRTKIANVNGTKILDVAGSVTAVCDVNPETRTMRVGFSFLNPTDHQLMVRGKGLATKRLIRSPITITGLEPAPNGKLKVTEALITYLQQTGKQPVEEMPRLLGAAPYRGKPEKCQFPKWFPGLVSAL